MADPWERIRRWGEVNAPAMFEGLNEGASEAEIAELERTLGMALPSGFRDCLKRSNGEASGAFFADRGDWHGVEQIAEHWTQRQSIAAETGADEEERDVEELIREGIIFVEGPVRPVLFDRAWVPFMDCNGDVFWALDFAPAQGGTPGQVVEVDWEGCSHKVVASSFDEFLANYADELESGVYAIADGLPVKDDEA
jgi:cell wall assembly regulator SMI1